MAIISYRRHRFPPIVIQHAVWLYLRFTLSYRDVEELLAERGLDISYKSVRSWVLKFGSMIARRLRQARPRPSDPAPCSISTRRPTARQSPLHSLPAPQVADTAAEPWQQVAFLV